MYVYLNYILLVARISERWHNILSNLQGVRPSNHATIQSILEAIGLHPYVPAPCCVPDVMSSITLLFFDENRNVVLKNYPGMTVESCACR